MWLGVLGIFILGNISIWLSSKTELDKEDYYGE